MKIILLGKNLNDIRPHLAAAGLQECAPGEKPELVVTHGGDGTMLGAARDYPDLPKLPLRDARTAPLCEKHAHYPALKRIAQGEMPVLTELPRICGSCVPENGKELKLTALNDVFLHTSDRRSALRYRVWIDGELYAREVVGDGVGLATPHGSTAYYRSITHSTFRVGIGLAFSNSTEEVNHLVLNSDAVIRIEIVRGPGILVADNAPQEILVPEGGSVEFRSSGDFAQIYAIEDFMCPMCRALRHTNKIYGIGK